MRVSDLGVKAAGALLAVVAVACCVHGISSVATTQDATVMDASGGIGLTADPTLCRVIAFSPNPPFHPDTALEPHISAKTVDHHYRAHQKGYVVKLNTWIASTPASGVSFPTDRSGSSVVSELIRSTEIRTPVNNLASQIFNHALYFAGLRGLGREHNPSSPLGQAIISTFGTFSAFQAAFTAKSLAHFGSGWVWLVHNRTVTGSAGLAIVDSHDAATPIAIPSQTRGPGEVVGSQVSRDDIVPVIVCDVWEHAYYLDRQQKRDAYVDAWFQVLDWRFAEARFEGSQIEYAGDGSYPNFFPPTFAR